MLTDRRRFPALAAPAAAFVVVASVFAPPSAFAQPMPPAPHEDDSFDIMNELAHRGLHDIHDETWNLYGQFTYITSYHPPLPAAYSNVNGSVNSFWPQRERGYTSTFTLFGAVKLWPGGAVYIVPEFIGERAFSLLRGNGGATENFELQKTGSDAPTLYHCRLFLQQTLDLGGERVEKTSDPMQLGATTTSRRLVLTGGNLSVIDIFDRNTVVGDLRQTFFNEAFMTHASFDFAADARGYSYGAAAELYWDDWVLRLGRFIPPLNPNSYPVEAHFWRYYGDQVEIEHDHTLAGLPGAVRLLAFHNFDYMGNFDAAVAAFQSDPTKNAASCTGYNYGSGNFNAPDLCWVRHGQSKYGAGVNFEQTVGNGVGVFGRFMINDGLEEVDAFDSADGDVSIGAVARGRLWHRPLDIAGTGFEATWISNAHARYLNAGGIDNFVGDGRLPHPAPEELFEVFYSFNFFKAVWLAGDYQLIANPAYNADRGPEHVIAGRVHAEF